LSDPTGLVVCRQASDPLLPGYRLGYKCKVCGKELQVSVTAAVAIESGMYPFCNPCGFAMHQRLANAGVAIDAMISPQARAQAREVLETLIREGGPK
jgi:predicted nucleic acid-binding Zn ribbon protein